MKTWQEILLDILNWIDPPTKQISREERRAYKEEIEQRLPQPAPQQVKIILDPRIRNTAAYDAPSPTTDGKIKAEGIRKRAMAQQLQRQTGRLFHHHSDMLDLKKRNADLPPTHVLPKVPHKYDLMIHSEPLPGETLHNTPAWLLDNPPKAS